VCAIIACAARCKDSGCVVGKPEADGWRNIAITLIDRVLNPSPSNSAMAELESYPYLTAGMEIKKSDLCWVSRGGFGAGFLTPLGGGPLERNNLRSLANNQPRSSKRAWV
jgi:hypothetical protein